MAIKAIVGECDPEKKKIGGKIACYLCDWKNIDGAALIKVVADFISEAGNITDKPKKMQVCQNCRQRPFFCSIHNEFHVVFIDSAHTCQTCVREEARLHLKKRGSPLHKLFHSVMRLFSDEERKFFYAVVRRAIGDAGGKKTSPLMCFVVAAVAKKQSWQMSFEDITEKVKNERTLLAMLPQKNKKYKVVARPS